MTDDVTFIKVELTREAALNYLAGLDRLCDPRLPFEVVSMARRLTGRQNSATMEAFAEARKLLFENAPADRTFDVHVPDHWRIGADGSIDTGNEFVPGIQERARQIEVEGWTPEQDDEHDSGEMAQAAATYALNAALNAMQEEGPMVKTFSDMSSWIWPWNPKWWKPSTPLRDIDKAQALLAAERGRLMRLEWAKGT
ncbi:MAG: hypothetical protein WC722_05840 [Rhodospirillales bacterium]|jgi:hypothetical protein